MTRIGAVCMAYNKVNAKNDYQIGVSALYQKLNYFAYK